MESWVSKEGGSRKTWKKRFLRVEQEALVYYVKGDGKEKKGDIKITTITGVALVQVYKGRSNCFAVHTCVENNRTYYIQAVESPDVERWVQQIELLTSKQRGPTIQDEKMAKRMSKSAGSESDSSLKARKSEKKQEKKEKMDKNLEKAEKVGKKVIKKLCELEWERFKDTGMDEIDEWFNSCGEVMDTVVELTEACEHANEGLLMLCEATELSQANIQDKTLEGIMRYFVSECKHKEIELEPEFENNMLFLRMSSTEDSVLCLIFNAINELLKCLNSFIREIPDLIPKIMDFVAQCQDLQDKVQNGVTNLNPLKAPKALKNSAFNFKNLLGVPKTLKTALDVIISISKLLYGICSGKLAEH